ncbi:MAG: hypothetical protein HYV93_23245 [Candidatus Rokubacteria bacterium]|nr:hypothetical protein [Candidatus Rokubacteria bacterium]
MRRFLVVLLALVLCGPALAWAGPVILGGDDLTDHGSRSGAGANLEGWLYIEKALSNLSTGVTRTGPFTSDIAALGSADGGCPPACSGGNAGDAIGSAASNLGLTVGFFDGTTAMDAFFAGLAAGAVNPRMIWLAGDGAANDMDAAEAGVLTTNASALDAFVASGGGLMSHGDDSVYGWLSALLPGISAVPGCSSSGATLTPAGTAAFPGLSNSDVDANAGPCHNHFEGDFGGLVSLVNDGLGRPYIIGGGAGTLIRCGDPGQPPCPTPGVPFPSTLLLLTAAGGLVVGLQRTRIGQRRRRHLKE